MIIEYVFYLLRLLLYWERGELRFFFWLDTQLFYQNQIRFFFEVSIYFVGEGIGNSQRFLLYREGLRFIRLNLFEVVEFFFGVIFFLYFVLRVGVVEGMYVLGVQCCCWQLFRNEVKVYVFVVFLKLQRKFQRRFK